MPRYGVAHATQKLYVMFPMSASLRKKCTLVSILLCSLLLMSRTALADSVLAIVVGTDTHQFARADLLARPDVANVQIANDVSYNKAMSYRAVPVAALLAGINLPPPIACSRRSLSTGSPRSYRSI